MRASSPISAPLLLAVWVLGLSGVGPTPFLRPAEPFRGHSRRRDPGLRGPLGPSGLAVLHSHHQRRRDDSQVREGSRQGGQAHFQNHGRCGLRRSAAPADGHHRQGPLRVAGGGRGVLLQPVHQDHPGRQAPPGRGAHLRPGVPSGPLPGLGRCPEAAQGVEERGTGRPPPLRPGLPVGHLPHPIARAPGGRELPAARERQRSGQGSRHPGGEARAGGGPCGDLVGHQNRHRFGGRALQGGRKLRALVQRRRRQHPRQVRSPGQIREALRHHQAHGGRRIQAGRSARCQSSGVNRQATPVPRWAFRFRR